MPARTAASVAVVRRRGDAVHDFLLTFVGDGSVMDASYTRSHQQGACREPCGAPDAARPAPAGASWPSPCPAPCHRGPPRCTTRYSRAQAGRDRSAAASGAGASASAGARLRAETTTPATMTSAAPIHWCSRGARREPQHLEQVGDDHARVGDGAQVRGAAQAVGAAHRDLPEPARRGAGQQRQHHPRRGHDEARQREQRAAPRPPPATCAGRWLRCSRGRPGAAAAGWRVRTSSRRAAAPAPGRPRRGTRAATAPPRRRSPAPRRRRCAAATRSPSTGPDSSATNSGAVAVSVATSPSAMRAEPSARNTAIALTVPKIERSHAFFWSRTTSGTRRKRPMP